MWVEPHIGIGVLVKRGLDTRAALLLCACTQDMSCKVTKAAVCKPGGRTSKTESGGTPILDLWGSRTARKWACCLNHPVYGVLLQQLQLRHPAEDKVYIWVTLFFRKFNLTLSENTSIGKQSHVNADHELCDCVHLQFLTYTKFNKRWSLFASLFSLLLLPISLW